MADAFQKLSAFNLAKGRYGRDYPEYGLGYTEIKYRANEILTELKGFTFSEAWNVALDAAKSFLEDEGKGVQAALEEISQYQHKPEVD